ncbi:BTB/POZ domain-containing protein 19-like isoform X2 [Watersipora subatra]|uniref:BTB/POZ domain-containing protein 19-like isoform X2 n=1 Tax=Watersipora subatra TaxID=2589382 RepID=UPI00355B7191
MAMSDSEQPELLPEELDTKIILRGPIDPFAHDMLRMMDDCESRCQILKTLFLNATTTDGIASVVLPETDPEILLSVLEFIYTNRVSISNPEQGIQVLHLALEYGLEELSYLCNKYLADHLGVATASDIMQAAVSLAQGDLKETALKYIEVNTVEVFKDHGFHNLTVEAMCEILESDALNIDELDIIGKVEEWVAQKHKMTPGNSKVDIARPVVKHLRLPLLTTAELKTVDEANKKNRIISDKVFSSAWRTLSLKEAEEPKSPLVKPRAGTKERDHHKDFQ